MRNVDTDEKKILLQQRAYTLKLTQILGSCQNLISSSHHEQSHFCNFDIKNEFLDPKNPHVSIFRHQIAIEMELQHYFQNLREKISLYWQKIQTEITSEPLEVFEKKVFFHYYFLTTLA